MNHADEYTGEHRTPDDQLNLRQRHPEFQTYLDFNEQASQRVRETYPCLLDEPYGDDPLQTYDLFPAAHPNAPVFVFIHGGYWRGLDKASYSFTAEAFIQNGYTVCVLNYRLLPAVRMRALIADIQTALYKIRDRAAQYNANADDITLCGHSAGGHLALIAPLLDAPLRPSIQKICSISGLFDLAPIQNSYLGDTLALDAQTIHDYSPQHLDCTPLTCPILITVGLAETDLFIGQSEQLYKKNNSLKNFSFRGYPDLNHYQIVHALADESHGVTKFCLGE